MPKEEPKIKIPDPSLDILKIFTDQVGEVRKSFNFVITFVIGVMLLGFLVLLFTVAGLVIDAWRFNSAVYKESQQLKIQEENIKNTVEQQKLILESLQKIKNDIEKLNESKK
jgi:hypothetical protein